MVFFNCLTRPFEGITLVDFAGGVFVKGFLEVVLEGSVLVFFVGAVADISFVCLDLLSSPIQQ